MGWATRGKHRVPNIHSPQAGYELNDYSLGMNSFLSNDKLPTRNGDKNFLRLAQDARIPSLGEYETRKGFNYYSAPSGVAVNQSISSTTGAADKAFSETVYLAQKWTASVSGALPIIYLSLSNTAAGQGTISVEHWTDNAGSPGTLVSKGTIAGSAPTATPTLYPAYFVDAPAIVNGTSYWIVVHIQLYGANSYNWRSTTSATTAKTSTDSGLSWSSTSYALLFQQYVCQNNPVLGLARLARSDGSKRTVFACASGVDTNISYISDESLGTLSSVKSGLSTSATTYRFATFNDVTYYVNGYDGLRKWDFTTESQVNSTNYTLICNHKGLLFLAGGADPNAVIYSNFGLPETYTSTDFVYADVPKNGDPVTALVSLNGNLLIFSRNNKFILGGDSNDNFRVDEAPDQKGTYSQETVCQDSNYVYFLSNDGVYRSNGSEAQLMSKNIYNDIQAIPDKSKCVMAVSQGRAIPMVRKRWQWLQQSVLCLEPELRQRRQLLRREPRHWRLR
jgi:hypothetical protein